MIRDEIMKMISDYIFEIEHREMIAPEFVGLSAKEVVWQLRRLNDKIYRTFPFEREVSHNELTMFQSEVAGWAEYNFGKTPAHRPLLGAFEELGELAHAQLKKEQGVREGLERFMEDAADAIGDALVFLAHYCAVTGLSLQDSVDKTWAKVRQRDWRKYPKTGMPETIQGQILPVIYSTSTDAERGDDDEKITCR